MPLVAGTAMLALAGVANAEENSMVTLTDAEMDSVSAGTAGVSADASGDVIVDGFFFLDNIPGVSALAFCASSTCFSGICTTSLSAFDVDGF